MARELLTPAEFSQVVLNRLLQDRPTAKIDLLGESFVLVREGSRRTVLSLAAGYRRYCLAPERREAYIEALLRKAYPDRRALPSLLEVRERILPQMVPIGLVDQCRKERRELAAIRFVGDLAISFVIDSPTRYTYVHRQQMKGWDVRETELLTLAVRNLERLSRDLPPPTRIGRGAKLTLVWEAFDGYDASRILLARTLGELSALVQGNPIIAVPHRDYMVMFGDRDPAFVEQMAERIREEHGSHRYPISPDLFVLRGGSLFVFTPNMRLDRAVN